MQHGLFCQGRHDSLGTNFHGSRKKSPLRAPGTDLSLHRLWAQGSFEALGLTVGAMAMHRRRHYRAEFADERLEKRAKSSPPVEERQPEMRRLKMVPEGNEAGAASASDGRCDETGRAGGATLAGGRRAEAGGDGSRGREMARPVSLLAKKLCCRSPRKIRRNVIPAGVTTGSRTLR